MAHEGSVHNSERRAIEAAEARAELRGVQIGIVLLAIYFERTGRPELAAEVRATRLVDRDEGNVVDLRKGAERG